MKKRVLLIMGLSIMLLVGGCSKKNNEAQDTTDKPKTTDSNIVKDVTVLPEKKDYNPQDYVTLGKYKGIEVTYTKKEVTDADVEAAIDQDLNSHMSYPDTGKKVVENGDMVNIDYEGKIDGKAFDGGSATDAKLTIGSGGYIKGFEEGLKGKKVGDKTDLKLTFPKDYQNADVAGKPVVFTVTIKAIVKEVVPTLNEKYVKDNTSYKTVDEYKKSIRDSLEAQNQQAMDSEKYGNAYGIIEKNSKIKKIPQDLADYYNQMMLFQYTNYVNKMEQILRHF
jgi:trigger factor